MLPCLSTWQRFGYEIPGKRVSIPWLEWHGLASRRACHGWGKGSSESDDPVENDHDLITGEPFSTAPLFLHLTLAARVSLTIKTP